MEQGGDSAAGAPAAATAGASEPAAADADEQLADIVHKFGGTYGWGIEESLFGVPWRTCLALTRRIADDEREDLRIRMALAGHEMPEPGFVQSSGLPDRFEESPQEASPAWRRALELSAQRRGGHPTLN